MGESILKNKVIRREEKKKFFFFSFLKGKRVNIPVPRKRSVCGDANTLGDICMSARESSLFCLTALDFTIETSCSEKWFYCWKNGVLFSIPSGLHVLILENPRRKKIDFRTCSYPKPQQVSKVSSLESIDKGR